MIRVTPELGNPLVGTVPLPSMPTSPVTPMQYKAALASWIDLLVAEAGPDAPDLLRIVERNEPISVVENPQPGLTMVEASDWLHIRAAIPYERIPLSRVTNDPETTDLLDDTTLESWLNALYADS